VISEYDIAIRLIAAAFLGALVGFERERSGQPAGLRTHIILVVGAALTMTLSINLAIQFSDLAPNGDPARMAAQVVSGIGFLGAGAIMHYGSNIKGLTTATSMWTMAIVGLVIGAGYFQVAGMATFLILVALILLNFFGQRFIRPLVAVQLTVTVTDKRGLLDQVRSAIAPRATIASDVSIQKDLQRKRAKFEMTLYLHEGETVEAVLADLAELAGVRALKAE
jgi:putative Mg2+ transporter-C (MgtC) family protein